MNILGWISENGPVQSGREIAKIARRLPKKAPGRELISRAATHAETGAVSLAIADLDRFVLVCDDRSGSALANVQSIRSALEHSQKNKMISTIKKTMGQVIVKWVLSGLWHTLISFPQISVFESSSIKRRVCVSGFIRAHALRID